MEGTAEITSQQARRGEGNRVTPSEKGCTEGWAWWMLNEVERCGQSAHLHFSLGSFDLGSAETQPFLKTISFSVI